MRIPKLPVSAPERSVRAFERARQGWRELIIGLREARGIDRVLMPAYVGRSPTDGSGLWDPLTELNVAVETYRTDRRALVDLEDLAFRIGRGEPALVLLIHYFGFPQPALERIAMLVRESDGVLVEDCAHSLLSEVAYRACGTTGDYSIYSFPKLLGRGPGVIADNSAQAQLQEPTGPGVPALLAEDWTGLSKIRRRNYRQLAHLIGEEVGLLHPELPEDVVPQSLPLLVPDSARDAIYHSLNHQGFGVTSLWHTLAHSASAPQDGEARWLSQRILNLPVHSPDPVETEMMADALVSEVRRLA